LSVVPNIHSDDAATLAIPSDGKLCRQTRVISKYGKRRENIITIRLRMEQLDIEVFNGIYCNGKEFPYNLNVTDSDLTRLHKDINNSFISRIISE